MDNVAAAAVVVGVVELVKNLVPGKVNGAVTWVVAAAVGGLLGYFHLAGVVDVVTGIALGSAAAGVHTVATAAGGK